MKKHVATSLNDFLNEGKIKTGSSDIEILQKFFEEQEFNVHLFEQDGMQCAEIEKWTDGGVDMIITLMPFSKEKFFEFVNDFDIDSEIDMHRQAKDYKAAFTISASVKDFTDFHNALKEVVEKINKRF